jgi:hypothetical protein
MTFYTIYFEDGGEEQLVLSTMSTEAFRLAHGGETNVALALKQAKLTWPKRKPCKLVRKLTNKVVWKK